MHRWSKLFIPTLREAPADAEVVSHKFLLRAGYVRQLSAGVYSYLFLGQRSLNKIIRITREEMDRIGQEFLLPALHPRELWEESGRWAAIGQNMFRLQDRKGAWLALGFTHEEVMTDIARKELRSYRQLPQIWYQIQTKFRDEPRPKSGLLRVRQFLMKDSYSFDIDAAGLDESYRKHDQAYRAIFNRCGLRFVAVEADSGAMGGSQSQEFMVLSDAGEDLIASCPQCGYAANVEKATAGLLPAPDLPTEGSEEPLLKSTPGARAIEEVCAVLNVRPDQTIKAVALLATYASGNGTQEIPVLAFLRGDRSLNETKLGNEIRKKFSGAELRMMSSEEVEEIFGVAHGFLGPYNLPSWRRVRPSLRTPQIYFDSRLESRRNLVAGANLAGHHYGNVTPGRDFALEPSQKPGGEIPDEGAAALGLLDLLLVEDGDPCPQCGAPLTVAKAVEIGHIFKLGYKYSRSMGARVLDPGGKEVAPIMGSYGIGMERILTAAVEQNHDSNGFWLPRAIAPFDVVVTVTNMADTALASVAEEVAVRLEEAGFDVLLDDRGERAGVKFKDADLVGVPYRINVGRKAAEGRLELVTRSTATTQEVAVAEVAELLEQATRSLSLGRQN